jgi:acyl-CoA thioester hydrolase
MTRAEFPHLLEIQTRWNDNDLYGHVNNVVHYAYFDTVINRYLIDSGLDIASGLAIGVCVESQCTYKAPFAFPDVIHAGLRVAKLGNSSVRYELGIFRGELLCAQGAFVHVFVDRATRKPVPIPDRIRAALARIATEAPA